MVAGVAGSKEVVAFATGPFFVRRARSKLHWVCPAGSCPFCGLESSRRCPAVNHARGHVVEDGVGFVGLGTANLCSLQGGGGGRTRARQVGLSSRGFCIFICISRGVSSRTWRTSVLCKHLVSDIRA